MSVEPLDCPAALSHHWLVRRRGGEKVLDALASLVPAAPVYTLVHDPRGFRSGPAMPGPTAPDAAATILGGRRRRVITSWLQALPAVQRYYPQLLPLLPSAARALHVAPARLVICSDAAIAKAMTVDASSHLVCYCHSPMRYVWEGAISGQYAATLPAPLRPLWPRVCAAIRRADAAAARRVDRFIANSRTVADRIRRCYGRDATVIYPPVDVPEAPPPRQAREEYYLAVGHHVAYKRLDLAVEACERLGRRLVVIGTGPDVARLSREHRPEIEFHGFQTDAEVIRHYQKARALLFPGEEDFGIVPVEALAHGCPVVAYGRGGAGETVVPGVSGVLFEEQSVDALAAAMLDAEAADFDATVLHAQARRFALSRFLREARDFLRGSIESPRETR